MAQDGFDPDSPQAPWLMTQDQLDQVIDADRRRTRRAAVLISVAFSASAAALTAAGLVIDRQAHGAPAAVALIVAAFFLLAAVVAPMALVSLQRARCRRWRQRQRECQELGAIVEVIQNPALGKLVSFNFRLMDRFIAVALGQARASFLGCSVAAATALLVLLAGTATVVTADNAGAQVTAGVLTAAGAALSGFLSVTFLRTFEMTSRQMSYYYGQPLVHCYLLHAEWLVERFDKDADPKARWTMHHELIRAALSASNNAQHHLLDLQRPMRSTGVMHDDRVPAARKPMETEKMNGSVATL
jgi:hypothetical protein